MGEGNFGPIPDASQASGEEANSYPSERWLWMQEIAAHLGVKTKTVYVWVSKKRLPVHKVGRLWKFKVSEVDAWVQSGKAAQKK